MQIQGLRSPLNDHFALAIVHFQVVGEAEVQYYLPTPEMAPRDVISTVLRALMANDEPFPDHGCAIAIRFSSGSNPGVLQSRRRRQEEVWCRAAPGAALLPFRSRVLRIVQSTGRYGMLRGL